MSKRIRILLVTCMMIFSLLGLQIPTEAATPKLNKSIEKIVKSKMANAEVSIAVRDEKGKVIYDLNGNRQQKPASNMKLLTGAAALTELGLDYRFLTNIYTTGKVKNGILHGDLYIQGKGDPTLTIEDLEEFARFFAYSGLKKIDGRIVADDF